MILSVARVQIDEAKHAHLFAAWSNLVTMDHPSGLIECWLTQGDDRIEVVALWEDRAAHDAAIADEGSHPSYRIFEATDTVAEHELLNVVGRIIVPL